MSRFCRQAQRRAFFQSLRASEFSSARSVSSSSCGDRRIGAVVQNDFFSDAECEQLVDELLYAKAPGKLNLPLRRWRNRHYQSDHWDDVITGYKELERSLELWSAPNRDLLARAYEYVDAHARKVGVYAASEQFDWLPPHVVDLSPDGIIGAHRDSVKFSGGIVSGISLISSRTVVLEPHCDEEEELELSMLVGADVAPETVPQRAQLSFRAPLAQYTY